MSRSEEERVVIERRGEGPTIASSLYRHAYYLWLLGPTIELPYEKTHW